YLGEVRRWRDEHAADAHHRLSDKRRDGIRALTLDERSEFRSQSVSIRLLGLTGFSIAPVIRTGNPQDIVLRQIETPMVARHASQSSGRERGSVIGPCARDEPFL